MIRTNDLSKSFDDFQAVDGVTLNIGAGEVLALLGPNGAGKTTTVRMLTSVLKPTRGEAHVAGFNVVEQPGEVRASLLAYANRASWPVQSYACPRVPGFLWAGL